MVSLGFIGLGEMGGPMATHLVAAGYDVTVYDLRSAAVDEVVEAGATRAADTREVGRNADVVFLSLPGPAEVETVVEDLEAVLRSGDVIVDTTTSTPGTTNHLAEALAERGIDILGAPVSGGRAGSEAGTLSVMIGGDPSVYEACVPVIEAFATDIFHVGDSPGHGHAVKLLNNYLSTTALVASSEAVLLGQRVGLDIETMCNVFSVSSGRNSAVEDKLPEHVATGEYDVGFRLELVEKDIRLLSEFGEENQTPLLLANVVRNLVGYVISQQGGEADMTRVYDFLESMMIRD